ncbi:MAG: WbqC family protein [bacterium]
MILAAHQPQFMPWLGYFAKMLQCDVFLVLDDVQFKKNEWQNRNKVMSSSGPQWLTVPVLHKFPQNINGTAVNNTVPWKHKHLKTLGQTYSRAAGFPAAWERIEKLYAAEYEKLSEINAASMEMLRGMLDIGIKMEFSSACGIEGRKAPAPVLPARGPEQARSETEVCGTPVAGRASERLVNLCRRFGADTYLAGAGGRDYMDPGIFEKAGIKVVFQEFRHPVYRQYGTEFISNLSAVDLIFHAGREAGNILRRALGDRL